MTQVFHCRQMLLLTASTFFFALNLHGMDIIRDGKVQSVVVLPDKPTSIEAHSGKLLRDYLAKIAGQTEPVQSVLASDFKGDKKDSVILVGRSETNEHIGRLAKKGLTHLSASRPGGDGIVIKTVRDEQTDTLVIGGSSDRAVLHAVVHFLEKFGRVGVFWDGEHVEVRKNWRLDSIAVKEKPYFPIRQYMQGCAIIYNYMDWWDYEQLKRELDWAAWKKQSRMMWPGGMVNPDKENPDVYEKFAIETFRKSKHYARERLGIELIGNREDHVYNRDPYPEKRVSEDPEEENRIILKFVEDTYKEIPPGGTWYASGWALLNPGWRVETARKFFDQIGDKNFYICDIWAEASPIYKKYDYFWGKQWGFGVLHSFGGNTNLHGDVSGLVRSSQAVTVDPKADKCIAYYINPEVIHYNNFYFDLAAQLSWRPNDVDLDAFITDYAERRYGTTSAPRMAKMLQQLAASVYGTNDTTSPFWQSRMGNTFPAMLHTRLGYIPHLQKALEIALGEQERLRENSLYKNDLADVAKQLVAEVFNGYALTFANAFTWKDKDAFEDAAQGLQICLDTMEKILPSRKKYWVRPVLDHINAFPGMTPQRRADLEAYLKDQVWTFALRDNLRDYNRRDKKEVFDMYYRPRVEAYITHMKKTFASGNFDFDPKTIEPAYIEIEKKWTNTPIPPLASPIPTTRAVAAAEFTLDAMRTLSRTFDFETGATVTNGGFELGNGKPTGWQVTTQNVEVTIPRDVKPYIGFYALHFNAPQEQNVYKTFALQQQLKWAEKTRILLGYCLEEYSALANAYLRVDGFDADGTKRVQVLYYWGGDSWDWKDVTPDETGGFYATAKKLGMPEGQGVMGKSAGSHIVYKVPWQELDENPAADIDAAHGSGTWTKLGVKNATLTLGTWVYEYDNHFIDGWFDELRVIAPPS